MSLSLGGGVFQNCLGTSNLTNPGYHPTPPPELELFMEELETSDLTNPESPTHPFESRERGGSICGYLAAYPRVTV